MRSLETSRNSPDSQEPRECDCKVSHYAGYREEFPSSELIPRKCHIPPRIHPASTSKVCMSSRPALPDSESQVREGVTHFCDDSGFTKAWSSGFINRWSLGDCLGKIHRRVWTAEKFPLAVRVSSSLERVFWAESAPFLTDECSSHTD